MMKDLKQQQQQQRKGYQKDVESKRTEDDRVW